MKKESIVDLLIERDGGDHHSSEPSQNEDEEKT